MNILLLGRTGQVGFELNRTLAPLGTIIAPSRLELDLTSKQAVDTFLYKFSPDLIVNAAAWTAVDAAEENRAEAERLNAGLPQQLATFAKDKEIRVFHYSSDYVYPGTGETPWKETSSPAPISYYGKTKLAGDQSIAESGADYVIFRTSWIYSARGNNFMKTMLRLAREKAELKVVADQFGAPTPARLIAQITTLAIHSKLEGGLYNLAPTGEISWHGFAQAIFREAIKAREELALDARKVHPVPTSAYPTAAKRPLNSRMEVIKLERALNLQLPDWRSQLEMTLGEYLQK